MTAAGNNLFFTGYVEGSSHGLYATNSKAEAPVYLGETVYRISAMGNRIFFERDDALWTSDGTLAGTRPVKPFGEEGLSILRMTTVSQGADSLLHLLLYTTEGNSGFQWWVGDGTSEGTVLLRDLRGEMQTFDTMVAYGEWTWIAGTDNHGKPHPVAG